MELGLESESVFSDWSQTHLEFMDSAALVLKHPLMGIIDMENAQFLNYRLVTASTFVFVWELYLNYRTSDG